MTWQSREWRHFPFHRVQIATSFPQKKGKSHMSIFLFFFISKKKVISLYQQTQNFTEINKKSKIKMHRRKTFMTFARQAIGKKSCGAAEVASSMPAPNSSNRSDENRSCQKLKFNPFIIAVGFLCTFGLITVI